MTPADHLAQQADAFADAWRHGDATEDLYRGLKLAVRAYYDAQPIAGQHIQAFDNIKGGERAG